MDERMLAIARAQSHQWVETPSGKGEQCAVCLIILSKDLPIEQVPGCPGLAGRLT